MFKKTLKTTLKTIAAAVALATALALHPDAASAQTTSCCTSTSVFFRNYPYTGYAYYTWFNKLWHQADGSVSLWRVLASYTHDVGAPFCNPINGYGLCNPGAATGQAGYGPYAGWSPIAIATNPANNNTYLLWHHVSGASSIWLLDVNLNYVTSYVIPEIAGWTSDGLTINKASNRVQVSWTANNGAYATWEFDPLLTGAVSGPVYGPYAGWSPGPTE
jgi:hypothetical protein